MLVSPDPAVPIPLAFLTEILPKIHDPAEIQVCLAVFRLVSLAGGLDAALNHRAIVRDRALRTALRVVGNPNEPDGRIDTGLELSVGRGTLIRFTTSDSSHDETWYYVNTPANQALIAAMSRGTVAPPQSLWPGEETPAVRPERPNVFRLYEQNIGFLTPLIADHLVDALETYPNDWIEDAIAEAVAYNRRSWRYIQRILENWTERGRGDNTPGDGSYATHRRRD
jgi:DnaD/phage-associated family protein